MMAQAGETTVHREIFLIRQHYPLFGAPALHHCRCCRRHLVAWLSNRLVYLIALVAVLLLFSGCTRVPRYEELQETRAVLPTPAPGVKADGRARFREIFCALVQNQGLSPEQRETECDTLLWRLADEPLQQAESPVPALDPALQVFVVGGAFSDCFGTASIAYRDAVERLSAEGYPVGGLAIGSRSSSEHNARMMAEGLAGTPDGPVMLVGYSKGAVDILYFLANYPDLARRVVAVLSVAGPIRGSEVARQGIWAYDTFLSGAFAQRCDPGDGGVLDSLLPETRLEWLLQHPLPDTVRFYSLVAFTTREHIARALMPTWKILASSDLRNDGQLTIADGIWPGSTLLGYVNSDHWGVAIDIEEELSFLAARPDDRLYPRGLLFEAALRYVAEDLREAVNVVR